MDKAYLIIDMPETCGDCALDTLYPDAGYGRCPLLKDTVQTDKKFPLCPLEELPHRKPETGKHDTFTYAVNYGWNGCLQYMEELME